MLPRFCRRRPAEAHNYLMVKHDPFITLLLGAGFAVFVFTALAVIL
jgi:hypothetical protein